MTILRSLTIICIHICLITVEENRDFQMTRCFRVSLGGQGSRSLKKDASMNKYIVGMRYRSTKAHYCWLLICSETIRLPDMCILIKIAHKYLSLLTSEWEKWDVRSHFGTLHNFLEKNRWQRGCNILQKPLPALFCSPQSLRPIPSHNKLCPFKSCLMAEISGVSSCDELSLVTCIPSQYHRDLYRHKLPRARPRDQSGQKLTGREISISHLPYWSANESIVGDNMRLSTGIYNACAQEHRKQNPLSLSAQIREFKEDWWTERGRTNRLFLECAHHHHGVWSRNDACFIWITCWYVSLDIICAVFYMNGRKTWEAFKR